MASSAIVLFSIAYEMRPNTIGVRVMNPDALLELIARELRETGERQAFDGRDQTILYLRPNEACALVSSGYGLSRSEKEGGRYHIRDGRNYLVREQAFPPQGAYAVLYTIEYHRESYDRCLAEGEDMSDEPFPPDGTTHVLVGIGVIDETYNRGQPPWACEVADPEPEPSV